MQPGSNVVVGRDSMSFIQLIAMACVLYRTNKFSLHSPEFSFY